jgi:sarcosine oxidase, subunit gamma
MKTQHALYASGPTGLTVRKLPLFGCLDLRVSPRETEALRSVAGALGATLPLANSWVATAEAHLLWQAWDEWLIITPDGRETRMALRLLDALGDVHCAITDVTDLREGFEIAGSHAPDVLRKGCAVDLHPRVFTAGACVQTALARVRVTLRHIDAAPTYEVLVERSFAGYLAAWLDDAAVEFTRGS